MAGRLIDLNQPGVALPSRLVVDTSVIINWLEATHAVGTTPTALTAGHRHALWFFHATQANETLGLVTAFGFNEVFHVLLRERFASAIPNHLPDLAERFPNIKSPGGYRWQHLFKARSDLLAPFVGDFNQIRLRLIASELVFLQPNDLGAIPSGRSLDEEMLALMGRYHLDTGDAAILLEAQRAGVQSVVTSDADLHRARLDFDVYTWL